MDSVVRGLAVYVFLLIVFRVAGKRTLAETTSFDFVLLLIISEATQQALVDGDNSMTNALLLVVTLVGLDIAISLVKRRFPTFDKLVDNVPLVIVEHGRPLRDRMHKSRVDTSDVLQAARESHGLERMDQIKYAVLERSGGITIVPALPAEGGGAG